MKLEPENGESRVAPEPPSGGSESRARIERAVKGLVEAREADDFEAALAYFAPDVVCYAPSTWGYSMFPTTIHGRDALREVQRLHAMQYEMMPTRLHRLLIDGDQAIAHRTSGLRERGGGPVYTFDCVTLVRFRDGLIVEFQEFVDGAGRDFINAYPR